MADQIQLRGGTTAETQIFTGASREVSVDTDKKVLVVHDGVQAGGYPQVSEESLSELRPGENLLLNSNFARCRRKVINDNNELFDFLNTGILANYGPDMWAVASSRTMERIFNDSPSYSTSGVSLRGKLSAGGNGTQCQLRTAVELSGYNNSLASDNQFPVGTTYTLSFDHKAPAGEGLIVDIYFRDGVNTSGNDVVVNNTTFSSTGTGSWGSERKSLTFTIPSPPSSTNQCLEIAFAGPQVTGGDQTTFIQLADVKLERGSVATPYVTPDRIGEEAKTARYCQSIDVHRYENFPLGRGGGGAVIDTARVALVDHMRTAPSSTTITRNIRSTRLANDSVEAGVRTVQIGASRTSYKYQILGMSSGVSNEPYAVRVDNAAESPVYIILDASL